MSGAISEKFSTFDMQIDFAIPPIFHFRRWLGEVLFPFSKLRNSYHFINQLVRKAKKPFKHFTTVPKYGHEYEINYSLVYSFSTLYFFLTTRIHNSSFSLLMGIISVPTKS